MNLKFEMLIFGWTHLTDRVLFDTECLTSSNGHFTNTEPVRSFRFLASLDLVFIWNVFPWTYHRWVNFFLTNLPVRRARDCVRPLTDSRGTDGPCLWWTSRVIGVWALWSRLIWSHEGWARLTAVICTSGRRKRVLYLLPWFSADPAMHIHI